MRHFRKQRALWRRRPRDVTPAQAAAVGSAAAAAVVTSETPRSLQVEEEDPDSLLPQVPSGSKDSSPGSPLGPSHHSLWPRLDSEEAKGNRVG